MVCIECELGGIGRWLWFGGVGFGVWCWFLGMWRVGSMLVELGVGFVLWVVNECV